MKIVFFKTMEAENHEKHGAGSKNQTSRGNMNVFRYVLLTFFVAIAMFSCSKDNDATYTLKYNVDDSRNVAVEAAIFEYDDDDRIVKQEYVNCSKGLKRVFSADSRATKVKVKITFKGTAADIVVITVVTWVNEVFYLKKGKNIDIEMNNETGLRETEPNR